MTKRIYLVYFNCHSETSDYPIIREYTVRGFSYEKAYYFLNLLYHEIKLYELIRNLEIDKIELKSVTKVL